VVTGEANAREVYGLKREVICCVYDMEKASGDLLGDCTR